MRAQHSLHWAWFLESKRAIFARIPELPGIVLSDLKDGGFNVKTVVEGARRVLQSSDLLQLSTSENAESLTSAAYVHSKSTGSLHYLAMVNFPKGASFDWHRLKFQCPCKQSLMGKGSGVCVHALSIVFCVYWVQHLKSKLPRWASSTDSLGPRSRSVFKHEPRFVLLSSPHQAIQFAWFQGFEERKSEYGGTVQTFMFDVKTATTPKFRATSWSKAKEKLVDLLTSHGVIHPPPQLLPAASTPGIFDIAAPPTTAAAPAALPPAKVGRMCSKCTRPMLGHKRGAACPPQPSACTTDPPIASSQPPIASAEPSGEVTCRMCGEASSTHERGVERCFGPNGQLLVEEETVGVSRKSLSRRFPPPKLGIELRRSLRRRN